ncbi:MAG: CHAP domain-containing protein [Candidatus Eremiobacteraeota bacterium]|nr:CHAP domain-containing protein [Candidatus Eremiobacteraeota bacterium]MCW5866181.1 CHAP domain-containing protein [Candidatus Eremiobacteraeota bacterium]
MAIGTVGTASVQNVGQTNRPAGSAANSPARFASQAADRTLGASTHGAVQTSAGAAPKDGQAVLDFAKSKQGQKVGSGECFDLADQALKKNGFKTASDYGPVTKDGDYQWGKEVPLGESKPGDVLQFRDYENETTTRTENDKGWQEKTETSSRPHHTAVVVANDGKGNITVLEQNAPKGSKVTQRVLHMGNGTNTSEKNGTTTTETQTTNGTVTAYRPEPKE